MKVGIVGTGFMGSVHAAAWAETPATIAGLVAATEAEAAPLAVQCGAPVYPDLESLLTAVDVVDVCAPTHLHYEIVMAAIAAGKHTICEKPLARTVEQAREMIAAAHRAGVELLVAHVVRFFPEYALAQSLVEAGKVGKPGVIRLARGSFRPKRPTGNWFLDEEKSGGMIVDLMIHDFDYARWIAGEVTSVFARNITATQPDAPVDYALAILTHASGALTHAAGSWAYPPPTFRTGLEIAGDGGLLEFKSGESAPIEWLLQRGDDNAPDTGRPSSPTHESPYTTQIKEFYAALAEGKPPRVSAEDGLAALQIALAAAESARTGKAVRLTPAEVTS